MAYNNINKGMPSWWNW